MRKRGRRQPRSLPKKWAAPPRRDRDEAKHSLSFFFGNVTRLGPTFRKFIEEENVWDVLGVAEAHVEAENVPEEKNCFKRLGLNSWWSPAQPTGKGGNSGGTFCLANPSLPLARLDLDECAENGLPEAALD